MGYRVFEQVLLASLLLLNAAAYAQQADRFQQLLDQAPKLRDAGDHDGAANAYLEAWRIGGDERFNSVWMYHQLCISLAWSCRCDEALQVAQQCAERFADDGDDATTVWSLLMLAENASLVGRYDIAAQCFKAVNALKADTDDVLYELTWQRCTTREYSVSFGYDAVHYPEAFAAGKVLAFLPRTDLPYQQATFCVTGAKSFEERGKGEQRWLEVVPNGADTFFVRCDLRQTPVSYWEDIKALKAAPCVAAPTQDPYLHESEGILFSDLCRRIAAGLAGPTQYQAVRNTMLWMVQNIRYEWKEDPPVRTSDDALRHGFGVCDARSLATVALLRASGVPARPVRGVGGDPPMWHTWMEIRSPIQGPQGEARWIPTDVGSTLTNTVMHLGIQCYPLVAPDAEMGFAKDQFYLSNIELFQSSPVRTKLRATREFGS